MAASTNDMVTKMLAIQQQFEGEAKLFSQKAVAVSTYMKYADIQKGFTFPKAQISIEYDNDDRACVLMDVAYKDRKYHFRSIEEKDAQDFDLYLNSQPMVRGKYSTGKVVVYDATKTRTEQFCERFSRNSALHLWSAFVVTDSETEVFLGVCNLGGGMTPGASEMAFLNRADTWSHGSSDVIAKYAIPDIKRITDRRYSGLGTAEVCTLLQFASHLKRKGYKIKGEELVKVDATARLDNEGSWKAAAKAGMEVYDVDQRKQYGPALRYQLQKMM